MNSASSASPSPTQRARVLEGLALVVTAVACIAFQLTLPGRQATDADYTEVARVIAAERQPGDVVLLAPWWTERARLFLPNGLNVVGYLNSERDSLELHSRIWVLSEPNLPRANMSGFYEVFSPGRTEVGQTRTFGNLKLQLFTNGRAKPVLFSAIDQLASATVYLEQPDGARAPCAWNGRSHHCPNGSDVLAEWHELKYQPRRCLRFFPPGGAAKLVAEFANTPAGASAVLMGGYIWEKALYRDGMSSSDLAFEVNGAVQSISLPPGTDGLQRSEVQNPTGGPLRVWVRADKPAARDICFELYIFGGSQP